MYEIYQDEFLVSEQELKEKIYNYLRRLHIFEPEEWSADLIESVEPSKSTSEILVELANIPQAESVKPFFEQWDNETILGNIAFILCSRLESIELQSLYQYLRQKRGYKKIKETSF